MKYYRLNYCSLIIVVLMTISCQPSLDVNDNTHVDYDYIGTLHNEGLDRIYDKISNSNTLEENLLIVETESRAMFKDQISHSKESEKSFTDLVKVINANSNQSFTNLNEALILEMNSNISSEQEEVALDVLQLLSTPDLSKSAFNLEFKEIEQRIYKTIIIDEQPALLAGLYLGRSSYFYWKENSLKWIGKLATPGSRISDNREKISDGELIGGADVAGAISGAGAVGLAAWAFGPIGWGFAAGFTVVSGLVSSGGAAIIVYSSK